MESSLRIVAITNCPAGIAHTYMVAEALEQKARSLGHTIKVETQGSSGVENRLSSEEIAAADYVILATGRGLSGDDRARFAGKKVYEIAISQALKNIDQIFSELPTNSQLFAADSGVKLGKQEVQSGSVMSHLMAGVSAALRLLSVAVSWWRLPTCWCSSACRIPICRKARRRLPGWLNPSVISASPL